MEEKRFILMLGAFVGIILVSVVTKLIKFIVSKAFGRYVYMFRWFWFSYQKNSGFAMTGFSPICELYMRKDGESDKRVLVSFVIEMAISAAVCAVCNVVFIGVYMNAGDNSKVYLFFVGIGLWYIVSYVAMIFFSVRGLINVNNSLGSHTRRIAQAMLDGVPMDDIEIPDYRTLDCKVCSSADIINYQCFSFIKSIWDNDKNAAEEIVRSLEEKLPMDYINKPKEYLMVYTAAYYDLLFYYSAVAYDKDRAMYIYSMVKRQLYSDKDVNGRRVLAYYLFYVGCDIKGTDRCIDEAYEVMHDFKSVTERRYEEMLIERLASAVYEKKKEIESGIIK